MAAAVETPDPRTASASVDDEMHDSREDLALQNRLGDYLRACDPRPIDADSPQGKATKGQTRHEKRSLREAFDHTDTCAKDGQAAFRSTTVLAACAGAIALGALILRTSLAEETLKSGSAALAETGSWETVSRVLSVVEFGAAALCLVLVLNGMAKFRKEEWLSQRYKAERLRHLKFAKLIDPRFWTASDPASEEWKQELEREVNSIESLSEIDVNAIGVGEDVLDIPAARDCEDIAEDDARSLVAYYRRTRLRAQYDYFFSKAADHHVPAIGNRVLVPAFFFLGVVFVIMNFLLEVPELFLRTELPWPWLKSLSLVLVILAGVIPAGLAAIRTIRSVYEWERTLFRARAMVATLTKISKRLYEEKNRSYLFAYLHFCEFVLSNDQREWARLMKEAEWYG